MAKKIKQRDITKSERNPNVLEVQKKDTETQPEALASMALLPTVKAGFTNRQYSAKFGETDLMRFLNSLHDTAKAVNAGDMSSVENHLTTQAQTLDTMFHYFMEKSFTAEYLDHLKTYADIGLKCQRQSRATWETLALIKNPQPYVRQQNVAVNQQVNNVPAPKRELSDQYAQARAGAGEISNSTNGLLTDRSNAYETLDAIGTPAPGRADKELEAVGAGDRAENG